MTTALIVAACVLAWWLLGMAICIFAALKGKGYIQVDDLVVITFLVSLVWPIAVMLWAFDKYGEKVVFSRRKPK